jgi:hypothetical protein
MVILDTLEAELKDMKIDFIRQPPSKLLAPSEQKVWIHEAKDNSFSLKGAFAIRGVAAPFWKQEPPGIYTKKYSLNFIIETFYNNIEPPAEVKDQLNTSEREFYGKPAFCNMTEETVRDVIKLCKQFDYTPGDSETGEVMKTYSD